MRLYALGLCLSIVQFDWFCRGYLDERKTGRWVYFIIATLSLYVNILLGLTLAAQNATLIFMQRWKEARQHFCSLVVVGVLFLPMFLLQLQNLQKKDTPAGEQSVLKAISFVIGSDAYHLGPVPRIDATLAFRAVLTITFVASFVWLVARNWRDVSVLQTTVWSYCLAITCLLIVFVIVAKLLPNPRYTFPLLLATLVAWGKVTEFIRRESVVGVVWSLTLAMCFWTLADTYRPLCKSGDWIRVKNFLQSHEEKNQPIVVFISEVDTILRNYYRGPNSIVPVPGPQRMDRFLYADFDIASAEAVRELLHPVLQNCNECWLVTYDGGILISPHQYHREFLDKYLQENFDAEVRTEFFDSSVTRLRRRIVIEKL